MSNVVDNRVVSMEFDNAKFEKNVEESLNTLKNLNKSLDSLGEGSAEGLDQLTKAIGNVSFEDMANSIDSIANKFTLLGRIGVEIVGKIANAVVGLAGTIKRGIDSITFDQIGAGWDKYAEKTTAVQTIINATGESINEVNKQLDKMMWFTDETSYNFSDMTNSVGKFTSNGQSLAQSVTAMEGISNWAALSGQNAQKASIAMYNLSQAISMGAVKAADWKSIELANMATEQFKKTVLETAAEIGTVQKVSEGVYKTVAKGTEVTSESFRNVLQEGFFTSDVLMSTLEKFGAFSEVLRTANEETGLSATELLKAIDSVMSGTKKSDEVYKDYASTLNSAGVSAERFKEILTDLSSDQYELGRASFKAAQEAKTFEDAINAVKDAASSAWLRVWENIFGGYDKAKTLWTNLANDLYDIFVVDVDNLNDVLTDAGTSAWDDLTAAIESCGGSVEEFQNIMSRRAKIAGVDIDALTEKYGSLSEAMRSTEFGTWLNDNRGFIDGALAKMKISGGQVQQAVEDVSKSVSEINSTIIKDFYGKFGSGDERDAALRALGYDPAVISRLAKEWRDSNKADANNRKVFSAEELEGALISVTQAAVDASDEWNNLQDIIANGDFSKVDFKQMISIGITNGLQAAISAMELFRSSWDSVFHAGMSEDDILEQRSNKIRELTTRFAAFTEKLKNGIQPDKLLSPLANFFKGISGILTLMWNTFSGVMSFIKPISSGIMLMLAPVIKVVEWFGIASTMLRNFTNNASPIKTILTGISSSLDSIIKLVGQFGQNIFTKIFGDQSTPSVIGKIRNSVKAFATSLTDFSGKFTKLSNKLKNAKSIREAFNILKDSFSNVKDKITNKMKDVKTAFENFSLDKTISSIKSKVTASVRKFARAFIAEWLGVDRSSSVVIKKMEDIKKKLLKSSEGIVNAIKKIDSKKVVDGITNFVNNLKTKITSIDFKSMFSNFSAKFGEILGSVGGILSELWAKLGEFVTQGIENFKKKHEIESWGDFFDLLKGKFKEGYGNLKTEIKSGAKSFITALLEGFGKTKEDADKIVTNIENRFTSFKERISSLFQNDDGTSAGFVGFINNIKDAITGFFDDINNTEKPEGEDDGSSFLTPIINFFTNLWNQITSFDASTILDTTSEWIGKLKEVLTKIALGSLVLFVYAGIAAKVLTKLAEARLINQITSAIRRISKAEKSNAKAAKWTAIGKALMNFAIAIGVMVAAIWLINKMLEGNDVAWGKSIAIVLGIAIFLDTFVGAMMLIGAWASKISGGKYQASFEGLGGAFLGLAASIVIMIYAIKKITDTNFGLSDAKTCGKLAAVLGSIIVTMGGLALAAGLSKFKASNGVAMLLMAFAIQKMVKVLADIDYGKIDADAIWTMSFSIAALAAVATYILGAKFGKALGGAVMMIALGYALKKFCEAMQELPKIGDVSQQITQLGIALTALVATSYIMGSAWMPMLIGLGLLAGLGGVVLLFGNAAEKSASGIEALGNAFPVLASGLSAASDIDFGKFAKGLGELALALVSLSLATALGSTNSGTKLAGMAEGLVAFGSQLDEIGGVFKKISEFGTSESELGEFNLEDGLSRFSDMIRTISTAFKKSDWRKFWGDALTGEAFTSLTDMATGFQEFGDKLADISAALSTLSSESFNNVDTAMSNLTAFVTGTRDALATADGMGTDYSVLGDISEGISSFASHAEDINSFLDMFSSLGSEDSKTKVTNAIDTLKTLVGTTALRDKNNTGLAGILNLAKNSDFSNLSALSSGIASFADMAPAIETLQTLGTINAAEVLQPLTDIFGESGVVTNIVSNGTDFSQLSTMSDSLASFVESFKAFPESAESTLAELIGKTESFAQAGADLFKAFVDGLKGKNSGSAAPNSENQNDVSVVDTLIDKIKGKEDVWKAAGADAIGAYIAAIKEKKGELTGIFDDFFSSDSITDSLVVGVDSGYAGGEGATGFLASIKDFFSNFSIKLSDIFNTEGFSFKSLLGLEEGQDISSIFGFDSLLKSFEGFSLKGMLGLEEGQDISSILGFDKFQQMFTDFKPMELMGFTSKDGANPLTTMFDEFKSSVEKFDISSIFSFNTDELSTDGGDVNAVTEMISSLSQACSENSGAVDGYSSSLDNFISSVGEVTNVGTTIESFKDSLSDAADSIGEWGKKIGSAVAGENGIKASEVQNAWFDAGSLLTGKFVDGIKAQQENMQSQGKQIMKDLASAMVDFDESIINSGLATSVGSFMDSFSIAMADSFPTAANSVVSMFVAEFAANEYQMNSAGNSLSTSGISGVSSTYGSWVSVGSMVAEGLRAGIMSKASSIAAAAASVVRQAVAAAKAAADINSPSRVFMEIGAYMSEGMAVGILKESRSVESASSRMTRAAILAAETAEELIGSILESDMTPTITPVIDLSDVELGASKINGMFSNNLSLNTGTITARAAKVSATAEAVKTDAQNGKVSSSENGTVINNFTQNNYSPESLSRIDIYRQTRNIFTAQKGAVKA